MTQTPKASSNETPAPRPRPRIHLRYLEIFHQVVAQGSMSDAARALGLTQPTVSGHILQLEKDLGLELLDRSHGRARPTAAGELVHRFAEAIYRQKQEAEAAIEAFLGIRVGNLVIGASTTPATYHLPACLARYSADHPEIDVRLVTASTQEILRQLEEQHLDFAVVGSSVESDRWESRALGDDSIVLVVGRGHAWFHKKSCKVGDLPTLSYLARDEGSATLGAVDLELAGHDLSLSQLPVLVRLPTNEAIREGLEGGAAAAFLPAVCVKGRPETLHVVEVKGLEIVRKLTAVWPRQPERTPAARKFLEEYLFRSDGR